MTSLADFQRFIADAEARRADGTTDPTSQYAKWAQDNPGELGRWQAFRDLVLGGLRPTPPTMTTPHGRELIDGAVLYLDAIPDVQPPPPQPPAGKVIWRGDYSAAFPGWDGVQRKAADRIVSVPGSAVGEPDGPWARFTVKTGDYLGAKSQSERAQLNNFTNTHGHEGDEGFWAWSTKFAATYNPQATSFPLWNIYQQWQHQGFVGQAMLNFEVDASRKALMLAVTDGDAAHPTQVKFVLDAAFKPGKRYDHVLHVHWSSDPAKGFFEVLLNGKIVVPLTRLATLYQDGTQAYAVQMLYRQTHTETDIVDQTGLRLADTIAAAVADFPAWPTSFS